ncbi:MAG: DUF1016 domain-containing protein [Spirulinaceae cyanobacterium RM2_2_10]|nr:DUF1016 domain-containing protein [Spirulinaceae cyanobacterium SM2_1_0]NJO19883.1 DUF1016 domain-containing protein [Spirulinaceae cyanobacterium RM2_2_10]
MDKADLHQSIVSRPTNFSLIQSFLKEMGEEFSFVGNQYCLEIGDQEFFLDILLYHRRLQCLVAVEIKSGEFLPEYAEEMQFYLAALDDRVKLPDENPSIGIILCKSKNRTIVEYALRDSQRPIGVSTYTVFANIPQNLQAQLPTPEQVVKLLEDIDD